jgi:predicted PurR-regulated permease PerM
MDQVTHEKEQQAAEAAHKPGRSDAEPATPPPLTETAVSRAPQRGGFAMRVSVVGLFIIALLAVLVTAKTVLIPIFAAMLLAAVFQPLVDFYRRYRIPAPLGAAVIVISLILMIFGVAQIIGEPLSDWLQALPAAFSSLQDTFMHWWIPVGRKMGMGASEAAQTARVGPQVAAQTVSITGVMLGWLQHLVAGTAATLILLFFLLSSPYLFTLKMVRVLPRLRDKMKAVEIVRTVGREVSVYFLTITCINIGLGVATTLVMYALGMPTPLLWGVMATLFNFVPYVGPATCLAVLALTAWTTFQTAAHVIAVPAAFFALTILEGQILNPLIVGNRLRCNPVVIFASMTVWAWMWGIPGLVAAVPILVVLKTFAYHVDALAPVAEFLSSEGRNNNGAG